ncbi:MAG TPA: metal-dependent hydrolase [Anaerolineales bacterium]|nr:metal-dependent hydrolase [Anaerolineales bacterium]
MPQNGVHAMAGIVARRWMPHREWLLLGLVLGNMFPDLDNLAVAYATLTGGDTHGLHRTFTHSIFTVVAVILLFYLVAALKNDLRWNNLGLGLGIGILMHALLDLILWFNGVEIFWPIRYEVNFWKWVTVPDWFGIILQTGEFLAFGLYFLLLISLARRQRTDVGHHSTVKIWMYIQFVLFVVFTVAFFTLGAQGLPYIIFGALYLISMIVAIVLTIRMRKTVEALPS